MDSYLDQMNGILDFHATYKKPWITLVLHKSLSVENSLPKNS